MRHLQRSIALAVTAALVVTPALAQRGGFGGGSSFRSSPSFSAPRMSAPSIRPSMPSPSIRPSVPSPAPRMSTPSTPAPSPSAPPSSGGGFSSWLPWLLLFGVLSSEHHDAPATPKQETPHDPLCEEQHVCQSEGPK